MFYVYGIADCRFCDYAKELLEEKGIGYSYYDITLFPSMMEMFKNKGWKTVPQVFEDETHIGGYTDLFNYFSDDEEDV